MQPFQRGAIGGGLHFRLRKPSKPNVDHQRRQPHQPKEQHGDEDERVTAPRRTSAQERELGFALRWESWAYAVRAAFQGKIGRIGPIRPIRPIHWLTVCSPPYSWQPALRCRLRAHRQLPARRRVRSRRRFAGVRRRLLGCRGLVDRGQTPASGLSWAGVLLSKPAGPCQQARPSPGRTPWPLAESRPRASRTTVGPAFFAPPARWPQAAQPGRSARRT